MCPVVSRWVWGVRGMSKPYYGLFLICARWRAGVPERTKCQTILWFGQTMLWFGHKKGAPAPARRGEHACGLRFGAGGLQVGEKRAFGWNWACARGAKARERPPSVAHRWIEGVETYAFMHRGGHWDPWVGQRGLRKEVKAYMLDTASVSHYFCPAR